MYTRIPTPAEAWREGQSLTELEDPVYLGDPWPREKSDQECPYCGTWFSLQGISAHSETCPVEESGFLDGSVAEEEKCDGCGYWWSHHLDCDEVESIPCPVGAEKPIENLGSFSSDATRSR